MLPGGSQAGWPGWSWGSAPERQQTVPPTGDSPDTPHHECFMITDGEMAEDLALHADGSVHQQRCAGRAETPIDRREFVDHVARLLSEEAGEVDLMPAEEMQAHAR